MNIDDRIKRELESETEVIDEILNDKQGLFDMLAESFKSGLGRWMILINVITVIVAGLMFWSGYEFFTSVQSDDRIFWGVCLMITAAAQISLKQWIWMEMNRSSLLREIKRVEIAVARLASKIEGANP